MSKTLPTEPCPLCAIKHLCRARIRLEEAKLGYPDEFFMALGEMSLAEAHLVNEYPALAEAIREARKLLESDPDFGVPLKTLLLQVATVTGYDMSEYWPSGLWRTLSMKFARFLKTWSPILFLAASVCYGELRIEGAPVDQTSRAQIAAMKDEMVVSNNITAGDFFYGREFRIYDSNSWTNSDIRAVWGACVDLDAYVFCPFSSATNANLYYPWQFVSFPGNNPSNPYSVALEIGTNGTIYLRGQLDMGGYSIVNIGDNSLHFQDGTRISSQQWQDANSPQRRAEGPIAVVLVYLLGWLGGKRRSILAGLRLAAGKAKVMLWLGMVGRVCHGP